MTQTKRPNYVLWMLCVFMLLSAASYFFRPKEPEISYAEVVQLFEQEKVKSFTVQDTTLTLKLREAVDGKTELRKELYDFDLFYDDLNDLVVEQKAAGILEDYNYSANHSPNYLAIALPYVIAVAGLFAIWYFFSMRASGGGNDRMAKFGNATFRHGSESARKTTFADVAGADEEKEELAEIVDFLRDPQRFVELGARIPKGVLLVGPPGTGKTEFCHWLAKKLERPLIMKKASDLLNCYVGGTEHNIAAAFEEAKRENAVLLFDEIDSFLQDRRTANHSWEVTQVNEFLTQMESYEGYLVATTNLLDLMDNACLRRFDLKAKLEYMTDDQAEEMYRRLAQKWKFSVGNEVNNLRKIRNLSPGDFAAIDRRLRFTKAVSGEKIVDMLKVETQLKEGQMSSSRRTIGFLDN